MISCLTLISETVPVVVEDALVLCGVEDAVGAVQMVEDSVPEVVSWPGAAVKFLSSGFTDVVSVDVEIAVVVVVVVVDEELVGSSVVVVDIQVLTKS